MKVATWNVNSLKARLPHLLRWLEEQRPDIVALQETKIQDEEFPADAIRDAGYRVTCNGQKTYNGVATLSRTQGDVLCRAFPQFDDPQKRLLTTCFGDLHVVNVYVPNGASVGSDKYEYKLNWLMQLRAYLEALMRKGASVVVLGDFNIAPEDRDVHDPELWRGQVLVSESEREHFRALQSLGLRDCFRLFDQPDNQYSWWDYRAAAFRRNMGLRIDLILADPHTAAQCRRCSVDIAPRKWERPSDHAPVVAEFERSLAPVQ